MLKVALHAMGTVLLGVVAIGVGRQFTRVDSDAGEVVSVFLAVLIAGSAGLALRSTVAAYRTMARPRSPQRPA